MSNQEASTPQYRCSKCQEVFQKHFFYIYHGDLRRNRSRGPSHSRCIWCRLSFSRNRYYPPRPVRDSDFDSATNRIWNLWAEDALPLTSHQIRDMTDPLAKEIQNRRDAAGCRRAPSPTTQGALLERRKPGRPLKRRRENDETNSEQEAHCSNQEMPTTSQTLLGQFQSNSSGQLSRQSREAAQTPDSEYLPGEKFEDDSDNSPVDIDNIQPTIPDGSPQVETLETLRAGEDEDDDSNEDIRTTNAEDTAESQRRGSAEESAGFASQSAHDNAAYQTSYNHLNQVPHNSHDNGPHEDAVLALSGSNNSGINESSAQDPPAPSGNIGAAVEPVVTLTARDRKEILLRYDGKLKDLKTLVSGDDFGQFTKNLMPMDSLIGMMRADDAAVKEVLGDIDLIELYLERLSK
ncbi:MAG: hypothetical protein M1831_005004 [Alyxoria varia]|nr:MAG: hypothetical protein M1831_005004 [Alyxoria varia]